MLARRLLLAGGGSSFVRVIGAPDDTAWTRAVAYNPILSPHAANWNQKSVDNASVWTDGSSWKGWYAGDGTVDGAFMGAMDSADGLAWTWHLTGGLDEPVLGGSHGGITGQIHQPNVYGFGATFYAFYSDDANSHELSVATSADGLTWTVAATNILAFATGVDYWASAAVIKIGATYHMLVEGRIAGIWETFYATSAALTSGWSLGNGGAALSSLQVAAGGMYGGPNLTLMGDGLVHNYYHAAPGAGTLPTNIYAATATTSDLTTWTRSSTSPILTHSGSGDEVNQLADPCLVLVGTTWRLYCSAVWSESPFQSELILATTPAI